MAPSPPARSVDGGIDRIPLPVASGGLWLAGKHVVGPDPEAALRRVGATTIVCLVEEPELIGRYPDYVAWLRANRPARAEWAPIPDMHAPDLPTAGRLLAGWRARLAVGEVLLVHCGAGMGRAGTMAAALLVTLGHGQEEAEAVVAAHRPMAGPEAGVQRDLLRALERTTDQGQTGPGGPGEEGVGRLGGR